MKKKVNLLLFILIFLIAYLELEYFEIKLF